MHIIGLMKSMSGFWRAHWAFVIPLVLSIMGCSGESADPPGRGVQPVVVARIRLEEDAHDLLGDIGGFSEAQNGDLLLVDALRPQVRRYSATGRLLASFGKYGAGPHEFRRLTGVVEDLRRGVLVVDPVLGRFTRLSAALAPETVFVQRPVARGLLTRFGGGFIYTAASGNRAADITRLRDDGTVAWSTGSITPGPPTKYPYWGSVGRLSLSASSHEVVTAFSLRYPVYIYDQNGTLVDSLPRTKSFRSAAIPRLGQFTGPGAARRITDWLDSFDVIAALSVVNDTLLVVTHGSMHSSSTSRFETRHQRFDVYHLPRRVRLAEDILLPEHSRILGGGRYLYVLMGEPPQAWTIARVALVPASTHSWKRHLAPPAGGAPAVTP